MEVALIMTIVFLLCLGTIFIFGKQIGNFFAQQNAARSSINVAPKYDPDDVNLTTGGLGTKLNIRGTVVKQNSDGSLSYKIEGQDINIPIKYVDIVGEIIETSGPAGCAELIPEINKMITIHKDEYPGVPVPVKVSFGNSTLQDGGDLYQGLGHPSTFTVSVGNHVVIIEKDIPSESNGGSDKQRRIEGTHDGLGNFTGQIYSYNNLTQEYESPSTAIGNITFNSDYVTALNHNGLPANFGGFNQADFDFSIDQFTP